MSMMTDSRPYLIRALYEWIADNDNTVHILVRADYPGVVVPKEYVQDDQIVLDISMGATRNLVMDNEKISFGANFKGIPHDLWVPIESVAGIYSKQTGMGLVFEVTMAVASEPARVELVEPRVAKSTRPGLRLVK